MFTAALSTVANTWKQLNCPFLDDWIMLWYIYSMVTIQLQEKVILPFAPTWMDLENIILDEISQTEKITNHMISPISNLIKE